MKYKLVIFDMDGTILDTLEDLTDSTNYALEKNQYGKRTIEEVRSFVGNGIGKLIERAVPSGTDAAHTRKVLADFTEYYGVHCADKTRAYDGIESLVHRLREAGYLTAVVSNKADFAVQDLSKQYFPGLFDYVVGERKGISRKPAKDTVYAVLEQLQVDRAAAIYVGDSEVDIQTARNAGMDMIAVTWGFRDREFLREQGAVIIANEPQNIFTILEGSI
ncbi:MAG: HAD-IA family hydrolase [Lachnospiraceae bacterium]|nr:HAD-IA family hydrolase [Lachnospiraceae bacterium]